MRTHTDFVHPATGHPRIIVKIQYNFKKYSCRLDTSMQSSLWLDLTSLHRSSHSVNSEIPLGGSHVGSFRNLNIYTVCVFYRNRCVALESERELSSQAEPPIPSGGSSSITRGRWRCQGPGLGRIAFLWTRLVLERDNQRRTQQVHHFTRQLLRSFTARQQKLHG